MIYEIKDIEVLMATKQSLISPGFKTQLKYYVGYRKDKESAGADEPRRIGFGISKEEFELLMKEFTQD